MNERIQELARQADNFEISPDEEFCDTDFLADIDPRRVKKFAELLLKASFDVVINDGRFHDAKGIIKAGKYTAMEHFGIEE